MSVCSCMLRAEIVFVCGVLDLFLRKKAFVFKLALCMSKIPFLSNFAVCQTEAFRSHFWVALGPPPLVLSSALLLEVCSAELWASKGTLPLTEANVALRARECLCFRCCCNAFTYYRHAPSATSNSGRLKISCVLRSTFAIKNKRNSWF